MKCRFFTCRAKEMANSEVGEWEVSSTWNAIQNRHISKFFENWTKLLNVMWSLACYKQLWKTIDQAFVHRLVPAANLQKSLMEEHFCHGKTVEFQVHCLYWIWNIDLTRKTVQIIAQVFPLEKIWIVQRVVKVWQGKLFCNPTKLFKGGNHWPKKKSLGINIGDDKE